MSEQQKLKPTFSIEKIYVRDLSLEVPAAPQVFLEDESPQIDMQLDRTGKQLKAGLYEVTLALTVRATLPGKTMFLCEVCQCGVFQIQDVPIEEVEPILGVVCPNILFPYAREAVSSLVNRAGFPPVFLSPVNFEALYMQQRSQKSETGD